MANNYSLKSLTLLLTAFAGLVFSAKAQLTVQTGQTPQQLVQNVLVGQGVSVSNITFSGDATQIGSFNGQNSNIGINSGIILSSGNVTTAAGTGLDFSSTGFGGNGDNNLDNLSNADTEDATVLTFDFIPLNDTVVFNYVFASEEYPEFVDAGYNDVFAFFITGNGYNNTNLAILPGTSTPVTIDNVNGGNNSQFYIDNTNGSTVAFDGFTIKLQALAIVVPCSTYTLKIAIADAGDDIYDSAVFLEAGSFTAGNADIAITAGSVNNVNDSLIVEGCIDGVFAFVRGNNFGDTTIVNFNLGGSATNGVDYSAIVDSVVFYPGDTTIFVNIDALYDGTTEGNENIIISLQQTSVCGNITLQTVSIVINDVVPIVATANASLTNTTPCTPVQLTASATGGFGNYSYLWDNGDTTATQTVNPGQTTTYNVIVSDECGTPVDTAFVTVTINDPVPITAQIAPSDTVICEGSVTFTATGAGGLTALSYSWSTGDSTQTITVTPTQTTTYTVTVTDSCGSPVGIAEVTVTIKCELVVPNVFTPNGDGTNDFFVIANLELYPGSKLYVYNRWGRKVYQSDDYKNNWAGDDMSEGVYYFVLDVPEKPEKLSGTVTILR